MSTDPGFLFVYGTLLTTDNQFGLYLNTHCRHYSKGRFKGKLYDIGRYPGAIAQPLGSSYITGSIWQMDSAEVLKVLDPYEGISADMPLPHEYTREPAAIETAEDTVICWIYLYNWPVNEAALIPSGDYLAYKNL